MCSSPLLRTRQTAEILAEHLRVPLRFEDDLREWDAGGAEWNAAIADFRRHDGEPPVDGTADWEPLSRLRSRAAGVLGRLRPGAVVVTHALVIEALSGADGRTIGYCAIVPVPSGCRGAAQKSGSGGPENSTRTR